MTSVDPSWSLGQARVPARARGGTALPVVGLTTALEASITGGWDRRSVVLPAVYRDAVADAGGISVLLPPQRVDAAVVRRVVAGVDALVLTGGVDVDPALYGATRGPRTDDARPDRDAWERELCAAALDAAIPVLAICRGLQLLDVVLGGTLHQHLPDVVGHERHSPAPTSFGATRVRVVPGTRLAWILGEGPVDAQCHHHQAIDAVGAGLVVSARADDGTVEAVELPGDPFVLGVQWHPEEDAHDRRLMEALVDAARSTGS